MDNPAEIKKRSVTISGHRTSVSLENIFWHHLSLIAKNQGLSLNQIVSQIDQGREGNLSSALRVFVIQTIDSPKE